MKSIPKQQNAVTVPKKPIKSIQTLQNAVTVQKKTKKTIPQDSWNSVCNPTIPASETPGGLFFFVFLVQSQHLAISGLI